MNPSNIKSDINLYNNLCFEKFNENMKIAYKKVCDKINENMHENIMNMVGKDLYDYSELVEINKPRIENLNGYNCTRSIEYNKFFNDMINGEIIISHWRLSSNPRQCGYQNISDHGLTLLTNYGRIYFIGNYINSKIYVSDRYDLNFWIPIDYINMILMSCLSNKHTKRISSPLNIKSVYMCLTDLLNHIKTNLMNGRYVKNNIDIKFMDVYARQHELEKKEHEFSRLVKKQNMDIIKQHELLNLQKKELQKQKEKFRLIASKIKIEHTKLNKAKQDFEERMLEHTNIDDLLNDV